MPITSNNLFGIHEQALLVRARRARLLASNLANADTPGFKAKDVDFQALMQRGADTVAMVGRDTSHSRHFSDPAQSQTRATVLFRTPMQPSLDGNTVDSQIEQTAFVQNAVAYQTTLTFLEQRIAGLRLAIRGE